MWVGPYRVREGGGPQATAPDGGDVLVHRLDPVALADPALRHVCARAVQLFRRGQIPHLTEVLGADLSSEQPYVVSTPAAAPTLRETGPMAGHTLFDLARALLETLAALHHESLALGALGPDTVRVRDGAVLVDVEAWLRAHGRPPDPAADVRAWGELVRYAGGGTIGAALSALVNLSSTASAATLLATLDGTPLPAAPRPPVPLPAPAPPPTVPTSSRPGTLVLGAAILAPPLVSIYPVAGGLAILTAAALYGVAGAILGPLSAQPATISTGRQLVATGLAVLAAPLLGLARALQQAVFLALSGLAGILLALTSTNDLPVETTLSRYGALAYCLLCAGQTRRAWLLVLLLGGGGILLLIAIGQEPTWWPLPDAEQDRLRGFIEGCPEVIRWSCR